MVEKEKDQTQYAIDIVSAMAERTIKKLWIVVILLIVLFVGSNAAWIVYESQFETVVVTQDVEQDADNGTNHFIGGDFYGTTESEDNG